MQINFKGQMYDLVSKEEDVEVSAIDADRPQNEKSDINKLKDYAFVLKVMMNSSDVIKSVELNGRKLDEIQKNKLYGIKENKGGTIKINVYKKYLCSAYDPIRKETTAFFKQTEGSEVELVNIVPDGYVEKEITIIDGRTNEPITEEERQKLSIELYYENVFKTAYISLIMPSFPITINHVYEKADEIKISVNTDEITEKIFSYPRNFSYIKGEDSVFYLPSEDIRFEKNETLKLVLLLKTEENIDLILNQNGNKYDGVPSVEKCSVLGNDFYKYTFPCIKAENVDAIRVIKK